MSPVRYVWRLNKPMFIKHREREMKRHKFIVEITDMEMDYLERRVRVILEDAIKKGMTDMDHASYFANLQVKSFKRVMAAERGKWRR